MEEGGDLRRRRAAFDRDWTQGSILGNLWSLSWPMMVTQAITTLGPTIDLMWVGKLGAASIAGVGISGMVVQLVGAFRMGLQTGTRAIVARAIGADNDGEANHAAQQSLVVTVLFSIVMAAIGVFFSRQMLLLLGLEADVIGEGADYLRIQLIGMVTTSFQMLSQSLMQPAGDAVTPMKISIWTRLFHVALSPFLIFGWWIFPRLGVSGAALTGIISQGIAGAWGMWILYSGRTRMRLTMRGFHFDWKMIWRITRIGIPASIQGMERTSATLLVTWFVIPFGTLAVAAHSLLDRVGNFVRMPAMAMGNAAGVLAGQNLGAKQPDRAEKTGWLAVGLFTGGMFFVSTIIWFWPEAIIHLFNTQPGLVKIGANFLRIEIVSFTSFGLVMVLNNCLNGVGDTWIPMLNTLVTLWGVQMPLAYILPKVSGLGVYGVRWAMQVALVARGIFFVVYFVTGRWKRTQV